MKWYYRVATGKGCFYIKKLADVDHRVLEALPVESLVAKRARRPQRSGSTSDKQCGELELLRSCKMKSQSVGRLHHPGIAQIYEAGSADTGFGPQPFFAMELIQGKP